MTHYPDPAGAFMQAFNRLSAETLEALKLKYLPAYSVHDLARPKRKGAEGGASLFGPDGDDDGGDPGTVEKYNSKTKYTCPCGVNVWGKPGLKISCGECGGDFRENGQGRYR